MGYFHNKKNQSYSFANNIKQMLSLRYSRFPHYFEIRFVEFIVILKWSRKSPDKVVTLLIDASVSI